MTSLIDRLRQRGQRLLEDDKIERQRAVEDRAAAEERWFEAAAQRADEALRSLFGEEPEEHTWRRHGWNVLLLPLGKPSPDDEPWWSKFHADDGPDGELLFHDTDPPEMWYRPRLGNASARIKDRDHLARMIAASSIYP